MQFSSRHSNQQRLEHDRQQATTDNFHNSSDTSLLSSAASIQIGRKTDWNCTQSISDPFDSKGIHVIEDKIEGYGSRKNEKNIFSVVLIP